ncbi:MAG: adenylate kinase [Mariprofundaceae bacterium]|nr:adenylate kinase [Mariprofundaceae bacterium]
MNIVLFGPPGVGKGTQGIQLSEALGIVQIAMGDLLRAAVKDGTVLGIKAKSFMDAGKLVPDNVVIGMIEERITAADAEAGFLLDGFPRNVAQAEALALMLDEHGLKIERVVFMSAPESMLLERLSGRLICKACGFGFHRHYSPPREEGCCDQCSGELYQRDDDREEVIVQRLSVYQEQTQPLLDYYSNSNGFSKIDAAGEVQDVYKKLEKVVQG